ncbi:unnamed protein product [Symbiodinium necroappetens]|uniref:Pentatricopeptide repeat-containing protein, chloroplastic n=1 Tax=Symbiodinium necroappetens TaxID=1628268 RepID=A0A812ME19_9DINO|nr:unnamed protein product [Symbiodinium necroappetens]
MARPICALPLLLRAPIAMAMGIDGRRPLATATAVAVLLAAVDVCSELGFARPATILSSELPADMRPSDHLRDLANSAYAALTEDRKEAAECTEFVRAIAKEDPVLAAVWLHEMRTLQVEPSSICYEAVIESQSREGLAAQASATLAAFRGSASEDLYSQVIESLSSQGYLDAVRSLEMKESGRTLRRHVQAIEAFAKGGDSASAKRLLDEAILSAVRPDARAYTAVISAFAKEGKFAQAEAVFELMENHSVAADADAWSWLLLASAETRTRKKAPDPERIFRSMVERGVAPTTFSFRALGRAIGSERSAQLCKELGLARRFAGRVRKSPKQRWYYIEKRPYRDGYFQPGDREDRDGTEKVWLGDDSMFHVDPFPKYFSFSPIFKPDKDHGTRRHRKPNMPPEEDKDKDKECMSLRAALGEGPQGLRAPFQALGPERLVMLGIRDADPAEEQFIQEAKVKRLTTRDLQSNLEDAIKVVADVAGPTGLLHVHLDLDVMDPSAFPHVNVPTAGGLLPAELKTLLCRLSSAFAGRICGTTVTELRLREEADRDRISTLGP